MAENATGSRIITRMNKRERNIWRPIRQSSRFIVDLLSIEEGKDVKEMFKKIYIDDDSIVIVEELFI
ncbi:hypothetical protein HanXRQr2_Chr11g0484161 [Helianthus annuus]|uniref:Uncharacterized protein n=1 Tax=Helianthus annuus TaxID=4232 RepID=A0A251TA17_HELAN|nr:hypothetical protein HanXRQr2_Chr11g0484161 [Helianthus annuus]KAJ0874603.1 hypothetical protein HanPSC8_Chr11g0466201 [Helianthus annuus]